MAPYHRRLLWPPDSSNDGESTDPSSPPPISGSLQFSPPPPPHQARFFAIGASLIAFALILFTYYVTFRWYPSLRRRRRRHTPRFAFAPPLDPPAPPEADGDLRRDLLAGAGEGEPYHVWLIRTRGLDAQTIGSISVCAYKREEGLVEGTDCSICLGEFMEGEMLRLLPKCSHAFHIPCIDTWLRSRVNCPLCRAPILAPRPLAPPPPIASSSGDLDPPSSAGNEPSSRITTPAEEESAPGADTAPEQSAIAPAGSSSSGAESEVWETIDLTKAEDDEAPCVQLEPLRRSVSMDSMALGSFLLRMSLVGGCNSGYSRRPAAGEQTSGCRNGAKEEDAAEMGRSSSTNGGVGFLSRISGRARRQ